MDEVFCFIEGRVGRIRLNRPKAIHALNHAMCAVMLEALEAWVADPSVDLILLDHAEGRGFCAGGDIRLIAESGAGDGAAARAFFRTEYQLNHALFTCPKPVVAFMDGITMGGGVGISQPARYRIATPATRFAMPETGIGLFPDVGGGWYLSRLSGRMGEYLALTGHRLSGAECLALGLATHFIESDRIDAAKGEMLVAPRDADSILARLSEEPEPGEILKNEERIDRCFAAATVEGILQCLREDGSEWAAQQIATLRSKSPLSMKVALRLVREGREMPSFEAEMRQEYAVGSRMAMSADFIEGVRALIVDKDHAPRWNPDVPEDVSEADVAAIFAPLPASEAWQPSGKHIEPQDAQESAPETLMSNYESILVEKRDGVTLITLNRPQALNALNSQILNELLDAMHAFDADPEQGCAVITGSPKAFAAGADIKEMEAQGFADMYGHDFFAGWDAFTRTRKPIIAAVSGFALGGGCELAMMCDFILASDTAKFGQPEIKLAVSPGMGGSQRLTRAVGKSKAMEMCLTGRMMDAEEAERAGLVSRILPAAELVEEAVKTAAIIASMAPLAVKANKEMVNAAYETTLAQGVQFERRLFHALFATADQKEGMRAFVEKRPGSWAGR